MHIVFLTKSKISTIQISDYCLILQTHSKCQINILWVSSDSGPHARSVYKCVYIMKGFIKAYLKLKEPILKIVLLRGCLLAIDYRVRTSIWSLSKPPYKCRAQSLTWKVAFTQVCTAAPEDPRMSGVIRGFEDSWLPSWSHSLYLKPDILSLLFGSTVRSPVGINKIFLFYDLSFQT